MSDGAMCFYCRRYRCECPEEAAQPLSGEGVQVAEVVICTIPAHNGGHTRYPCCSWPHPPKAAPLSEVELPPHITTSGPDPDGTYSCRVHIGNCMHQELARGLTAEEATKNALQASLLQVRVARAEVEELKRDTNWLNSPHDSPEACPSYYDGCNCTVEALEHNIKRAEAAKSRVSVLEGERNEFERKGKELAAAYGHSLIEIGDLKRLIRGFKCCGKYELCSDRSNFVGRDFRCKTRKAIDAALASQTVPLTEIV